MSLAKVFRDARQTLDDAGLRGGFLVRDLRTGDELGIEPDAVFPVASLVKVPLALAVLQRIERGEIDPATPTIVQPNELPVPGPVGMAKFRHPATVAVEDLLYLSVAISDGAAADALFDLVPPTEVSAELRHVGLDGIAVRHRIRELTETPAERLPPDDMHLAQALAIGAVTEGHGHAVPQLDVSLANTGSARAFVELLQALWAPSTVYSDAAARLRELMDDNVFRQRLAPAFSSDTSRWSSKTGTLLNLRHEIGVVEHRDGQAYAVAALTESSVPASDQPAAETAMARVARMLRDRLRADGSSREAL